VDKNEGLSYRMDCHQMTVNSLWEKRIIYLFIYFLGGELFLVNLGVIGSLDHTFMQINKNNITNQRKRSTKSILRYT